MIKDTIKTYLQEIAKSRINFKVTFHELQDTGIDIQAEYININMFELYNSDIADLKKRGHIENYLELFAILHEIAHYKQSQKFPTLYHFSKKYHKNSNHYEYIADRYARRYTPRLISEYRTSLKTLENIKKQRGIGV